MFAAIINTPGYLPDTDAEPPTFETAREAWQYLADERVRAEDECDDETITRDVEPLMRRASEDWHVADFERVGTVTMPTPGYTGDHDLGVSYTVEEVKAYANIVFLQDEEGREIVDKLTRTEGVVVRGATDETIAETIQHLAQWDMDEPHDIRTELGAGTRDEIVERDGYILTWNVGLGYVGLMRRL